jgi:LysM repeat protein
VYDASGNLVGVDYTTAGDAPKSGTSKKIFIVDAHGNILLSREQSWNSPTVEQRQILIGDELELRYSINYGSFGSLQDEQKKAFWDAYNKDAYQSLVTPGGTITAQAGDNPTTGQVIVVREGDTLQSIAQRVYGTADAWYRLAEANSLNHDSVLVPGSTVVAPAAAADTNKLDFNTGKLIGSTAPNLPPPPPDKKNCITLIIVAVAVVVACVVAPYMATFAAGLVGGAGTAATVIAGGLTAAAANVASQAVGIAAGVQDGMNWKSVGKSALGGAIGAGFNAIAGNAFNVTSSAFVNAGLTNIASQGVMIALHQQEKFSWASVAGAAVSAGVGNSDTMKGIQESMKDNGWSAFAQGAVRSGISGFFGSLTTDLIVPGKQDWAQIGISSVGSAINGGWDDQARFNKANDEAFMFNESLAAAGKSNGAAVRKAFIANSPEQINAEAGGFVDPLPDSSMVTGAESLDDDISEAPVSSKSQKAWGMTRVGWFSGPEISKAQYAASGRVFEAWGNFNRGLADTLSGEDGDKTLLGIAENIRTLKEDSPFVKVFAGSHVYSMSDDEWLQNRSKLVTKLVSNAEMSDAIAYGLLGKAGAAVQNPMSERSLDLAGNLNARVLANIAEWNISSGKSLEGFSLDSSKYRLPGLLMSAGIMSEISGFRAESNANGAYAPVWESALDAVAARHPIVGTMMGVLRALPSVDETKALKDLASAAEGLENPLVRKGLDAVLTSTYRGIAKVLDNKFLGPTVKHLFEGVGHYGEVVAYGVLKESGLFSEIHTLQNYSGQGLDMIGKAATGLFKGKWTPIEIKTSAGGAAPKLSDLQAQGPKDYVKYQLNVLTSGANRYRVGVSIDTVTVAQARKISADIQRNGLAPGYLILGSKVLTPKAEVTVEIWKKTK